MRPSDEFVNSTRPLISKTNLYVVDLNQECLYTPHKATTWPQLGLCDLPTATRPGPLLEAQQAGFPRNTLGKSRSSQAWTGLEPWTRD